MRRFAAVSLPVSLPLALLLATGCAASKMAPLASSANGAGVSTQSAAATATAPPTTLGTDEEKGEVAPGYAGGYATPSPAAEVPASGASPTMPSAPPAPVVMSRPTTPVATPPPPPPPAPMATTAPAILQQPAGIKAGEWDDNANYREFVRWIASEEDVRFHHVDVGERRFLVVRDADGKGVPRCKVTVSDAQQRTVDLTTVASGRAILFPHAEGLQGRALSAVTTCQGATASARFTLDDADGAVDLQLSIRRTLPAHKVVDVAFVLDTTGSMSEEINAVKSTLAQVVAKVNADSGAEVRLGMVAFKDRGDEYVTRVFPMTTDVDAFERAVSGIYASGGGDMPESVNEGLHVALSGLDWQNDAIGKYAFLIGDAPPHLDYQQDFDYAQEMRDAAHRGIQMFTVAASGMDVQGQVVWRQVAQYTGATNLFVLRGGAGPQSAGAGDPRSSCGGTQTSYTSGHLDELILGKVRHELHGIDRDPMRIPGLQQDENAKPCADRLLATD